MLNPIDPIKIIVHKEKINNVVSGLIPSPITVMLDITNQCNSDCVWCLWKDYKDRHNAEMSEELILKTITDIKDLNADGIYFSGGGEPLTNINFSKAVMHCNNSFMNIPCALNTNGLLLDKVSDKVIKSLSYIRVSLDAGSEEIYKELHRPKIYDFNHVLKNIEYICKKKLTKIGVGFLLHPCNYRDIYYLAEYLDEIGCGYLQLRPLKDCALNVRECSDVYSQIKRIKSTLDIVVYESISKMYDTINKDIKYSQCYMNKLIPTIGSDGFVYTCCELRGIKPIGNIKFNSLKDIWGGKNHRDVLEKIDITECPPCKYAKMNEIIERIFVRDEIDINFI
jgi:MoaA/NifB/PqqE/SkfB family radical SAM enzyme